MKYFRNILRNITDKAGLRILPLSVVFLFFLTITSCEEMTNTYSNREFVRCNFIVSSYTELFGVMGNYGQFASIRQAGNGKLRMNSGATGNYTDYTPDKIQQYFSYGLGGLIVGTNYNGDNMCYDLACPYCDAPNYRLNLTDNGLAKCPKCGVVYDLNNNGVISAVDSTKTYNNLRGLYRYHIVYDGTNVSMYN